MAKAGAELKLAEARAAKLERIEREKTVEVAELKKSLEESKARISVLEAEKASVEVELDKIQDDTLVMLGESFDQAVQHAHLFYNEPPPVGTFDATKDVYEGRLVPFDVLEALKNVVSWTSAEEVEDEDRERFKHSSVGRSTFPSFLSKRAPHSPFIYVNSRLGWYLQKALRRSSENSVFDTRCY